MDEAPFLDANLQEEDATPARLLVGVNGRGNICGMRQEGHGEINLSLLGEFLDVRSNCPPGTTAHVYRQTAAEVAHQLIDGLNAKLANTDVAANLSD
jgi:exosome complex RNA-binding protein Rrp42 (RNase PH superfamily)